MLRRPILQRQIERCPSLPSLLFNTLDNILNKLSLVSLVDVQGMSRLPWMCHRRLNHVLLQGLKTLSEVSYIEPLSFSGSNYLLKL